MALVALAGTLVVVLTAPGPGGQARRSGPIPALVPLAGIQPGGRALRPLAELAVRKRRPLGPPGIVRLGPRRREVALTFDDGYCGRCAASIVRTLRTTGAHATFFPNGVYGPSSWDKLARAIRELVARGQVAFGNHTFTHRDARSESAATLGADLRRNESWIRRTFHTSARPFFRPPYGSYNQAAAAVAGSLGYPQLVLWSGTLADSSPRSVPYLEKALRFWARPGAIILAHANYPATARALPALLRILRRRQLRTVTLPELLGGRTGARP